MNNNIDNILDNIDKINNKEATEKYRDSLETEVYNLNKNINILQQQNYILIKKLTNIKRNVGCMTFVICIPFVISIILIILRLFAGFSLLELLKNL